MEILVSHHARRYGRSKYGVSRTIHVFLDLLLVKFSLSFLTKPLQIFGLFGLLTFVPGMAICIYLVFARVVLAQGLADRHLFLLAFCSRCSARSLSAWVFWRKFKYERITSHP
jgi:hypothetical protein